MEITKRNRKWISFFGILVLLTFLCVTPMLSSAYHYNRTHVTVEEEEIRYASVKNTLVTQKIYCQGRISDLGITFYAPSGELYADASVTITVSQGDVSVTDVVPAVKLRTLSGYQRNPDTMREENSKYLMSYIFRGGLGKLAQGEAVVSVTSRDLPEGTDLFCLVSATQVSGLPSAMADDNILGAPMVLEYDVFYFDGHFWYETTLYAVLLVLFLFTAYVLVYRREWLERGEILYWSAVLTIFTVVSIRNPYASFWGEPRSEAVYEFWDKAENLGFFGSLMSLMSGEALAWFERVLMWAVNLVTPRKYVFTAAQLAELAWISMVTAMPCLRSFRRFFSDEIRLAVSLIFGTILLFDSAYYFWSCSYWALFFLLLFPLLELEKMRPAAYWAGIVLTVILCVSRIFHILLVPVAVAALLLVGKQRDSRFRIYCGCVAAASLFEVVYSLSAGASLAADSNMLSDVLEIGLGRMFENTLYYQAQTIVSYFTGSAYAQGSGGNLLALAFFCGIFVLFLVMALKKQWKEACWIGGLGLISLGSIAICVYTSGSHPAVSFPMNYASPVDWGKTIYQEADLHFSYSYICLSLLLLTFLYWTQTAWKNWLLANTTQTLGASLLRVGVVFFCGAVFLFCCAFANHHITHRLSYDKITVEWKESYQATQKPDVFLAVNTFYGAAPISLEHGTDEMIFGVDDSGKLYEWQPWLPAYEQFRPYHCAPIGEVSNCEERPILSITARRALTNFRVNYAAIVLNRNGEELARAAQAQTDNRLWLDFFFDEPVTGAYTVVFELADGSPAYIQDGLQIGYVLD